MHSVNSLSPIIVSPNRFLTADVEKIDGTMRAEMAAVIQSEVFLVERFIQTSRSDRLVNIRAVLAVRRVTKVIDLVVASS